MEKFKGKDLYKTRIRKQTIKNLVIKTEKLHNKQGVYVPVKHNNILVVDESGNVLRIL